MITRVIALGLNVGIYTILEIRLNSWDAQFVYYCTNINTAKGKRFTAFILLRPKSFLTIRKFLLSFTICLDMDMVIPANHFIGGINKMSNGATGHLLCL